MCNYELVDDLEKKFRLRFEREYWFCGKKEPSRVIEIKLEELNLLYDFL